MPPTANALPQRPIEALRTLALAAVVGALTLWLSNLLAAPAATGYPGHGQMFQRMSEAPWAFDGAFPQRILWPLLAHWTGLDGPLAPVFSQVCNGLLLAVVFWFCQRRGAALADAALVTVAIAASGVVQVYKPMACSSDPLNYILLLLAVHWAHRPALFWSLILLSAFSHEMVFFFAPWLIYHRCRGVAPEARGTWRGEALALAAAAAVYQSWRMVVQAHAEKVTFDVGTYLAQNLWLPWGLPALWALLLMVALIEFGPLLAVAVANWRRGDIGTRTVEPNAVEPSSAGNWGRWGPALFALGVLTMCAFAYDVMRFANYAFLPIVVGVVPFLRRPGGRLWFAALFAISLAARLWLRQPEVGWWHESPGEPGGWAFPQVTNGVVQLMMAGHKFGTPTEAWEFHRQLLAQFWPAAVVLGLGVVAIAGLGLYLGRDRDGRSAKLGR